MIKGGIAMNSSLFEMGSFYIIGIFYDVKLKFGKEFLWVLLSESKMKLPL